MIYEIMNRIPSASVFFGAFLSFAIPFAVNTINRKIHQVSDPPWKRQQ
ncbi:hypothetical protein [Paenibacillus thermotolerans]|nr:MULTISPECIES: hypothetical protein [unclassified Paenibacillus]